MRTRSLTSFGLALLLLAAGCAKSQPPSPAPDPGSAPEATQPGKGAPELVSSCNFTVTQPLWAEAFSTQVESGTCITAAHTDSFGVAFHLPPGVTEEAARAALQVTGTAVKSVAFYGQNAGAHMAVNLPEGPVGEEITLRLTGPVGPGGSQADLGFQFKRLETPRVMLELKGENGGWRSHEPGVVLPAQPLLMRLKLHGNPERRWIEERIQQAFRTPKDAATPTPQPRVAWEDDETVLLEVTTPIPTIFFEFAGAPAAHGLAVVDSIYTLHLGAAPRLVALDPATGNERAIAAAVTDIHSAAASPDGEWVVLAGVDPDQIYSSTAWLYETSTGKRWKTQIPTHHSLPHLLWSEGRLVAPGAGTVIARDLATGQESSHESKAWLWGPPSPDGRYFVGVDIHYGRGDQTSMIAPVTVAIHEVATHQERVLPDALRTFVKNSDSEPYYPIHWSGDGSRVLLPNAISRTPLSQGWVAIDPATGAMTEAKGTGTMVQPEPPAWVAGPTGWKYRQGSWGPITVQSPDGTEHHRGDGLGIGWKKDGSLLIIRWPDFPFRRVPSGL